MESAHQRTTKARRRFALAGFFVGGTMLLTSALTVILSVVAFAIAWANTDVFTGRGPRWADWVGYGSIAAFCIGCFGVLWALGEALMEMV